MYWLTSQQYLTKFCCKNCLTVRFIVYRIIMLVVIFQRNFFKTIICTFQYMKYYKANKNTVKGLRDMKKNYFPNIKIYICFKYCVNIKTINSES